MQLQTAKEELQRALARRRRAKRSVALQFISERMIDVRRGGAGPEMMSIMLC